VYPLAKSELVKITTDRERREPHCHTGRMKLRILLISLGILATVGSFMFADHRVLLPMPESMGGGIWDCGRVFTVILNGGYLAGGQQLDGVDDYVFDHCDDGAWLPFIAGSALLVIAIAAFVVAWRARAATSNRL